MVGAASSLPIPIAVLPFVNLNQDAATDYFADGLTGEIIRNLSVIDGLAVRSRTSSFAFKGKPPNIREAGKQLQADYILEGSVLRAGQRLRINAQFIRVRDDFPLRSVKFDRELTDVFAIQDEIARNIVNSLRLELGRTRRRYETSTEAYDNYLRARAAGWGDDRAIPEFDRQSREILRLHPRMQDSPRLTPIDPAFSVWIPLMSCGRCGQQRRRLWS